MSDESEVYQAYLLRLWRAQCEGRWTWRASLESPHTGEHQWFGSLEQLFAFLCEGRVGEGETGRRGEWVRGRHGDAEERVGEWESGRK